MQQVDSKHAKKLTAYYRDVFPYSDYLSETFSGIAYEDLAKAIKEHKDTKALGLELDPLFLAETEDFFTMSLVNFLGYKYLMGGGYRSWAFVTLYYSNFYIANAFLRIAGKAIVHPKWFGGFSLDERPKRLSLIVERFSSQHNYHLKSFGRGDEHQMVFTLFAQTFPELIKEKDGDYLRDDRVQENYQPRFPSQSLQDHALQGAKAMYDWDFIDFDQRSFQNQEFAEYISEIYAGDGYKEDYSAQWIKTFVNLFAKVGYESRYKQRYRSFLEVLFERLDKIASKPTTLTEVRSWLDQGIKTIG